MSFFISDAMAEAGQVTVEPGMFDAIFPFVVIFIVFYFLLIRPQQRRAKEHKNMTENLQKGDEIVTAGGLLGKVTTISEEFVTLEIADGIEVKLQRASVTLLMPKGTIKNL